jgi:VWFA-related protein
MRSLASAAVLVVLVAGAAAQTPQFPSAVELVTVDVVVLKDGVPVTGLTRDDFVITEGNEPRKIASFEALVPDAMPFDPAPDPSLATNEKPAPLVPRAYGILFDDVWISPLRENFVRESIETFLNKDAKDGDQVLIGNTSGDIWWSARLPEGRADLLAVTRRLAGKQSLYAGREDYVDTNLPSGPVRYSSLKLESMTEIQAMEIVRHAGGASDNAMAQELDGRRRARVRRTLGALEQQVKLLQGFRARRSVLLFSSGFLQDQDSILRDVANLSRLANVAVYFIDVREVRRESSSSAAEFADVRATDLAQSQLIEGAIETAGSQDLADDTGGFSIRNTNDLGAGVARIVRESGAYYLLGFEPPAGAVAGRWRPLKVEVKTPGLTVRARRGYAPGGFVEKLPKAKEGKAPPEIDRALRAAEPQTGVPLRAMAYSFEPRGKGTTRVLVAAEFDAGALDDGGKKARQFDFSVTVRQRDSKNAWRQDGSLGVMLAAGEPGWRAFTREFDLPPGVALLQVAVREEKSGRVGSVAARIEVEAPDAFRLSTPIVTDKTTPESAGDKRPRPALAVHRRFAPAGQLYCEYEVFGAARPGKAPPRVLAGLQLRTLQDGRVVLSAPPTSIAPDKDGRLVRLAGIPLAALAEGRYELVLSAEDAASGAKAERREAFELAR